MALQNFNFNSVFDTLDYTFVAHLHPNYINPRVTPELHPGVQFEVLKFGTTDLRRRSLEECMEEAAAYDEAMADIGFFQPSVDLETGKLISVNQRYNFWADPSGPVLANPRTFMESESPSSEMSSSPQSQSNATFSPTPAHIAVFPRFGNPRPSFAPITGTGVFYERIEPTAAQLAMESDATVDSEWVSPPVVAPVGYFGNLHDNESYETSSVSSSSYLHDSASTQDLNSADDRSSSESESESNVAIIDEINDSTSQYSSDSGENEDAGEVAQRSVGSKLSDEIDNETQIVSGDNMLAGDNITVVATSGFKPKIDFDELQKSSISSMLPEFLAQMGAANEELEAEQAAGTLASRRIELDEEDSSHGPFIEMNLGLGVLEEVANPSTSESEESEVGQGVMDKLMGASRKRSRDDSDSDSDSDEEKNVTHQKKRKLIEEF